MKPAIDLRAGLVFDAFGLGLPVRIATAVVAAVTVYAAAQGTSMSTLGTINAVCLWACVALSVNLVIGICGQMNLANTAFMGFGAYAGVLSTGFWHWPAWITLTVAALVAGVAAWMLSAAIFRSKGLVFAVLTTAISLVAYSVMVNWSSVTGGLGGISTGGPLEDGGLPGALDLALVKINEPMEYLVLLLTMTAALSVGTSILLRRKTGRSWLAVREDEVLAASLGIDVPREKRRAFVAASMLGTSIGLVYAHMVAFITPDSFTFAHAAFAPLVMIMIGGSGTAVGPIIGASIVIGVPEALRAYELEGLGTLIYGCLLLFVVLVAPTGVAGGLQSLARRAVAHRRAGPAQPSTQGEPAAAEAKTPTV